VVAKEAIGDERHDESRADEVQDRVLSVLRGISRATWPNGAESSYTIDPRMVRFLTAGESHGRALVVILEGVPAGLRIDLDTLTRDLRRRQGGYGRGRRMAIESDRAEILSGVRAGETIGGPIAMVIENRDWVNWQQTMYTGTEPEPDAKGARRAPVTRPRPGHADLAGVAKYGRDDVRDILERASARETAARVAAGGIARQLLAQAGVGIASHVFSIGTVRLPENMTVSYEQAAALPDDSPLRCVDEEVAARMIAAIDAAKAAGDTMGGGFEVIASGVPIGLGSYVQWDRKLDGRLGQALMSIPAIKAVGIGIGPEAAARPGSRVHDEIVLGGTGSLPLARPTNNAGGLEGGVTNGEDLRVSAWMKPIATLMKPLRSVDLKSLTESGAAIERSDVCAVPAAAVVGEAMVALTLADALVEKFGGDSVAELTESVNRWKAEVGERFRARARTQP
jgi:chorismate synthase